MATSNTKARQGCAFSAKLSPIYDVKAEKNIQKKDSIGELV